MIRVLGVDPSLTSTGLALITGDRITTRLVKTAPTRSLRGVADRVRYIVGQALRFAGDVDLAVIEEMYVPRGDKAAGGVLDRAWLWGLLVDQLLQRCEVVAVSARTRAKYAAGNGRASKAEVVAAMRSAYPGVAIPGDDVADALSLAAMGARALGHPSGVSSKEQDEAMRAVRWPAIERKR